MSKKPLRLFLYPRAMWSRLWTSAAHECRVSGGEWYWLKSRRACNFGRKQGGAA